MMASVAGNGKYQLERILGVLLVNREEESATKESKAGSLIGKFTKKKGFSLSAQDPEGRPSRKKVRDFRFWLVLALSLIGIIIVLAAILAQNTWFLMAVSLVVFFVIVFLISAGRVPEDGKRTKGNVTVLLVLCVTFVLCIGSFYVAASKQPEDMDLADIILNNPNPYIRNTATISLASQVDPYAMEYMSEFVDSSSYGKEGIKEMGKYYLEGVEDPDQFVRSDSLKCLSATGFDGLADLCLKVLKKDNSSDVRSVAVDLLIKGKGGLSEDALNTFYQSARNDKSTDVRNTILAYFGKNKMTGAIPVLVDSLANDKDCHDTAQKAIYEMPNEAVVGPLIESREKVTENDAATRIDSTLTTVGKSGNTASSQLSGLLGSAHSPWVEDILVNIGKSSTGAVINQVCYGDMNAKWSGTVVLLRIADPNDTLIAVARNHDFNGIAQNYPAFIKKGVEGTQYIIKEAARYLYSVDFNRFVDMGNNLLNCGNETMGTLMHQLVNEIPNLRITSTGQSSGSYNWGSH